jgi:APA family basic amino acid/polyamine antiporter
VKSFYWLRPLIKIGAIAGLTSVILVLLFGQTRIFYTMARDKCCPDGSLSSIPYTGPRYLLRSDGIAASFFAGIFLMFRELVSIGTLFAFVIVCVGVLVLRYADPELRGRLRSFLSRYPALGAVVSFIQMAALPMDTWLRLIIWMLIGFCNLFLIFPQTAVI